jgi:hypothetical protein
MATRVQQRGPVTDFFGEGPLASERYGAGHLGDDYRLARCVCVHGKEWPEGDLFEGNGGLACAECSDASLEWFKAQQA